MFSIASKEWPGLSKLSEECGEVVQVIGKLMGTQGSVHHWDGTNLRDRLIEEIGDLMAACEFVAAHNHIFSEVIARRDAKYHIFSKWHYEGDPLPVKLTPAATLCGPHE